MEEPKYLWRSEYRERIEEFVASDKLPKSYKKTVISALEIVLPPKDDSGLATFNSYMRLIPNVPDSLRMEMDKHILDGLVSEKRLSAVSRDNLLRELSRVKLYHDKSAVEYELDKQMRESEEQAEKFNEEIRRAKESEKYVPFIIIGALSVISVVVVVAWGAFASWVNSHQDFNGTRSDRVIPGLGITAGEYQRRYNCLNYGC